MGKLLQRVVTAAVSIAILLLVLFVLPAPVAEALFSAGILAGAWEWAAFAGFREAPRRVAYAALVGLCGAVIWWQVGSVRSIVAVGLVSLLWWAVALVWILRYPRPIRRGTAAVAGFLALAPAWICLLELLRSPGAGPRGVLVVLVIVWAADVGAYFAGRRFGRIKLAPRVSPGKTWEGVIGGLAAAAVASAVGARVLQLPTETLVPFGLGVALISIVGDLTVSLFKRNVGLKDSGSLFPGHGGVLDRIDSVSAAVPLFTLGLALLGRLAG